MAEKPVPQKPDDLTFAELRLANLLADRAGTPVQLSSGSIGSALASMVIHADFLAAAHGVDLGAEIRKQFSTQRVSRTTLQNVLEEWPDD